MNCRCLSLVSLIVFGAAAELWTVHAGSDQWTNIGPEGGSVTSLAVDPQNSRTVYAGTAAGIFKSQDGGASWRNSGLMGYHPVFSLGIDPQDANTVYAVTSQPDQNVGTISVFRSTDAGATWNEADSGLAATWTTPWVLVIDPINRGVIYVVTGVSGVWKSTDGGDSWQLAGAGLPDEFLVRAWAIDPQNRGTLYAAGIRNNSRLAAVFKSLDGGASWNESDSGLPLDSHGLGAGSELGLTIDPSNPATLYLSSPAHGIFKTVDGGSSWTAASSGINLNQCCFTPVLIGRQDPDTLFAAAGPMVFKSTDGGTSWISLSPGPQASYVSFIALDPQDSNTLYAASGAGVIKSADAGATWVHSNSGLRAIAVFGFQIDPQDPREIHAGTANGVFRSQDGGRNWLADNAGIKFQFGASTVTALAIDPQTPANLFAGTSEVTWASDTGCGFGEGGVFRSADAGMSWTDTGLVGCVSAIVIDPKTPSTVYAASGDPRMGVVKSTDGGASWTAANAGLLATTSTSPLVLAIDPQTPGTLYAMVQAYVSGRWTAGLFKSTNGARTWSSSGVNQSVIGVIGDGYPTWGLTIYPQGMDTVYVATASYVRGGALWKSTDGGASWRNLMPSSSANVYGVVVAPDDPAVVYAGTDAGVLRTTDSGASWEPIPGSPGFVQVLAFDPQSTNILYAAGPAGLFAIEFGGPEASGTK